MTMYRGEGANHGLLDAALLVDQLKDIHAKRKMQQDALDTYEDEVFRRAPEAVLKSRRACLDAHRWELIQDDSPFIGARVPP
jgi:2-polyprenyl-6-methoxyphenol hydroxylase-like FAD-dependent oxidoreductase